MAYTTIDKPSDYFNTKLYTGAGSELAVSGVGFSPSMTWFKQRDTTRGHVLEDIVRGAGNTLFPNIYTINFDNIVNDILNKKTNVV